MAQAMAGLLGSSQAVLEGSLHLGSSTRLSTTSSNRVTVVRSGLSVRAQQVSFETESSRRAVLGLIAAGLTTSTFAKQVLAAATSIKVGPPPPPSGGLPGTENSDEARDFDLPLKQRFYLQSLPPTEAAARIKDSAKEIVSVKESIDKKAWPYVQNDLRSKASYLRFDLNTVLAAKPKDERKSLKELGGKLFTVIDELDYAAKVKSPAKAEKAYAETIAALNNLLAKLG